jgi:hypothetical protein
MMLVGVLVKLRTRGVADELTEEIVRVLAT